MHTEMNSETIPVSEDDLIQLMEIEKALHGFWMVISHPSPSVIDSFELSQLIEPHVAKFREIMQRISPDQ